MHCADDKLGRREFVERALQASIAAACSLCLPAALAEGDDAGRPAPGDLLVGVDDPSKKALTAADIPLDSKPVIAYPFDRPSGVVRSGSRLNKIALVRLAADTLDADSASRSAGGVLAFSAVCTHQGCQVGQWLPAEQNLMCFCHFSKFAVRAKGAVVSGPAPRSLPVLPLTERAGELVVAAPFSTAPGASHQG
jgi:Rieske Fe-S protein